MTLILSRIGRPLICFNAEGGGGGGGGEGGGEGAASPESILFPNEGKGAGEGVENAGEGGEENGDSNGAGDWKEYQDDPNKTPEENAAAKAEHDKNKPADDGKRGDADKVPEDGKYSLQMPEGIEVDQELLDALGGDFKELGLTNGQAQKLADKFIEVQSKRMEERSNAWGETVSGWVETAKADKEIGGDKWDATVATAQRAVNTLGTPELKEYLNASFGGNHPELIRFMAKVGAMIKEDNPAAGGAEGRGKPAEPAHLLFPDDAPKG